jgi:hypothetical protein
MLFILLLLGLSCINLRLHAGYDIRGVVTQTTDPFMVTKVTNLKTSNPSHLYLTADSTNCYAPQVVTTLSSEMALGY